MEGGDENAESATSEILLKTCPRCKTPVANSTRYGNHIKQVQADINAVKEKSFGSKQGLQDLIGQVNKLSNFFKFIQQHPSMRYRERVLISETLAEENRKYLEFKWLRVVTDRRFHEVNLYTQQLVETIKVGFATFGYLNFI